MLDQLIKIGDFPIFFLCEDDSSASRGDVAQIKHGLLDFFWKSFLDDCLTKLPIMCIYINIYTYIYIYMHTYTVWGFPNCHFWWHQRAYPLIFHQYSINIWYYISHEYDTTPSILLVIFQIYFLQKSSQIPFYSHLMSVIAFHSIHIIF